MGIQIGNNKIAKIFKGTQEVKEVFRGENQVFVSATLAPTISFVSATQSTLTISVLNNDPETLTLVKITHGSTTQDFNVSIATGVSGNVTVTGLDPSTSYNFFANADANGKGLSPDSNIISSSTLAIQNPTFSNFSSTQTSITFRVNNPNSIAGTVFYARNTDPTTSSASSAIAANGQTGNLSFTGLTFNTSHSIRARLQLLGNLQPVISETRTTSSIAQPTHSLVSRTQLNVTVRTNNTNNTFQAVHYYAWNTNPTTSSANQTLNAGANGSNISRSFTPGQTQSFRSFARASNINSTIRSTNFASLSNSTPTITRGTVTATSVAFTLRNNNAVTATIRYHVVTNTSNPTSGSQGVSLGANATSGTITVTGLADSTTHRIRANAHIGASISGTSNNQFNTPALPFSGPGPSSPIAGNFTTGFFGQVTQTQMGTTMTQVMSDLGVSQGTARFVTENLLKFVHNGKIKFINRKIIRSNISWGHISARLVANGGNVYGGATMTFGGNSYKVRLMRGWGRVSANLNGTGTPNYQTGPLFTISFVYGAGGNRGVNWPTNTSGWATNNPNEWNTLIFPIASASQSQTTGVPNWASYSNSDLQIVTGAGRGTWTQETDQSVEVLTNQRVFRGYNGLANAYSTALTSNLFGLGLRLVFELI